VFDFRPSIRLSEDYSSNFELVPGGESNFRTSLSPGIFLGVEGTTVRGRVAYTLTAAHDTNAPSDDHFSLFHGLSAVLAWDATPWLTFQVTETFTRSDEPRQADALDLRRGREVFSINTLTAEAIYRINLFQARAFYSRLDFLESDSDTEDTHSQRFGGDVNVPFFELNLATLGYEYLTSRNSNEITGHQGRGSLSRRFAPSLSLGLSGGYSIRDVDEKDPTLPDDTFRIWSVGLFGTYSAPSLWSLRANVGVSHLESDIRKGDTLPTALVEFSYSLGAGVLTLTGDVGYSESFESTENVGVVRTWGVFVGYTYPFTPYISGSVLAGYRENEFTGVGGGTEGRDDQNASVVVGAAWRALMWLTVSVDYGYQKTWSTLGDYSEHRARVALTAQF
jgi:hypothetical protein